MKAETHNGWTNYETWAVKLWIDEGGGIDDLAEDFVATQTPEELDFTENKMWSSAAVTFGGMVRQSVDEMNPLDSGASMYADLLNAALGEVNWTEIASHIIEGVISECAGPA